MQQAQSTQRFPALRAHPSYGHLLPCPLQLPLCSAIIAAVFTQKLKRVKVMPQLQKEFHAKNLQSSRILKEIFSFQDLSQLELAQNLVLVVCLLELAQALVLVVFLARLAQALVWLLAPRLEVVLVAHLEVVGLEVVVVLSILRLLQGWVCMQKVKLVHLLVCRLWGCLVLAKQH